MEAGAKRSVRGTAARANSRRRHENVQRDLALPAVPCSTRRHPPGQFAFYAGSLF